MKMMNYTIDTKLLPKVWLTWMGKNGRIWANESGDRQDHPQHWMDYDGEYNMTCHRSRDGRIPYGTSWVTRNSDKIWISAGSQLHYAYAKYHPDIDRLELAAVKYDTTRGETNHTWHYAGDRIFIGKDKSIINEWGRPWIAGATYTVKRGSTVKSPREMIQTIMHSNCNDMFTEEFKKFIGKNYYIIGNGTSVNIEHSWHFMKWFDSKQKTRTTGKSQKLVDELVQMPLGSIEGLEYKYAPKAKDNPSYYEDQYINNIVYFERVNAEWSVLRALVRTDSGEFEEVWRAYIGDDGTNRIATKSDGDWIPSNQPHDYNVRRSYYFANPDEAKEKCTRIKYIAPMMTSHDGVCMLMNTLRFPFIEQLYKMGQTETALHIAHSNTPKAEIKSIFGYYNEKEKSALRQIGMTKHQLDEFCTKKKGNSYHMSYVIARMREALGDDLSRIDNVTFIKYLNALSEILGNFWGSRYVNELEVDKSRFWKNVVRLNDKNSNSARVLGDTLSMYHRLHNQPEIDWLFDDYSDIVRVHDAFTELYNQQEAERRARYNMSEAERLRKDEEKRKKTDEKRRHYEYEDDKFIIRLPKDVNEIVREGSLQSICIGGYTGRHSNGETNLFFLRKKNDETTPFYAIEMSNNKTIVQIHGSCNRWLGNNPEAIPTVVRWLRKNGIKCDTKILTCTARGYRNTNEYIEMPKVD